jgi:hypothetical protein
VFVNDNAVSVPLAVDLAKNTIPQYE